MKKIQNSNKRLKTNPSRRLAAYLSASVCVAGTQARADIVVTLMTHPDDYPVGITFVGGFVNGAPNTLADAGFAWYSATPSGGYFTGGWDLPVSVSGPDASGQYRDGSGNLKYGATADALNYASIYFGVNAGDKQGFAVGQFDFTTSSGSLVAIAQRDDRTAISISAGKAEIDAAAVPEPSGALLALLALGATACARRRRHAVPR